MSDEIIEVEQRFQERSLRDLYYIFFRHRWKIILFFLAAVVFTAVITFYGTEVYRSEAKLLVRVGRETVTLDPTAATGAILPVTQTRRDVVNTELEILKSRELVEKVVDAIGAEALLKPAERDLSVEGGSGEAVSKTKKQVPTPGRLLRSLFKRWGLTTPLSDRDNAVFTVVGNLDIKVQRDSSIVGVSYEAQSPKLAQIVLSKLVDVYLEEHIAAHQTPGSYQFFTQQADHLRAKLTQLEAELRKLMNETGISSLEEQQRGVLDRISTLKTEIGSTEAALAASRARAQVLQKTLADTPELVVTEATVGLPNAALDTMRARLYEMQLQEQDLVSKFEQGSRQVQEIRRQIAAAQALLEKEKQERATLTKGLSTAYEHVRSTLFTEQATLSSLQAQIEALRKGLSDAQTELRVLNDGGLRITALTREIDIQEANYRKYSDNLEQARIDHALEQGKISNINVVQSATLPILPVRPRKTLNLLLGLLVGVIGGVGLAFYSEHLDHSIKTPEEAEQRLHLPTLACIPRVRANRVSAAADWNIPARVREQYEAFKQQLLLGCKGSRKVPRVLAITGSHRDEGASTVAANLAAVLARPGDGDVLLIDANPGHPSVHQMFQAKLSPGLADIVANGQNGEAAIVSSPVQNLHILAAGTADGNLSEMLDSDGLREVINSMKKNYRFVVIDLPAVNEASWTLRLAGLCDGVGLVVEAERSRWEVVQRTKEQLAKSNAHVLGVVINKRRYHIPGWLYRTL